MSWLRDCWRRIGTPDAISWPGFWATFIAGVVGSFANSAAAIPLGPRLGIVVIGQVVLWVPLCVMRVLALRDFATSRPNLVVATFVGAALVRTSVLIMMIGSLYGPAALNLPGRFIGIVVNIGPAFAIAAIVVSSLKERRRQIGELAAARERIAATINSVETSIEQRNVEAVERVRTVLEGELSKLEAGQAQHSLAILQRTAAEVIRPMSHELAHSLPESVDTAIYGSVREVPWAQVWDSAATGRPFRPFVIALIMGWELFGMILIRPADALGFVLLDLLIIVCFMLTNVLAARINRGRNRGFRITVTVIAACLASIAVGLSVPWLLGQSPSDFGVMLGMMLFLPGFALGSTILTALYRERERVIGELTESSRTLERTLVRQRQVEWFQRKALSRALHGPVQMAVTAEAIRLDAAIREDRVTPGLVDEVRGRLISTLDVLNESDGDVVSFERGFKRMLATWDGVCEINLHISWEADAAMFADGVLRSIVIDIVTEAVSNAVWHGKATVAAVRLEVDESADMRVSVVTDGQGGVEPQRRGLGTQLLDDCTLRWERFGGEIGSELTAALPV